ncbi:hypothetical protein Acr_03g0007490 [Actinidia rufa]|uniref:Uncharacterized protein n=1 Tax=Actinidia rufa TaxID=165716 RepID=A0A7J0EC27_9ERIC|nr:hypothetical protein Acr_03g0007490 [Actinidia rufa]
MAKTIWMRPNVMALSLCAFQAHFFSTRALLPWFQATKPARRVLTASEKISWTRCGGYGGSKLDSRWSHSIRATTQVNDSGSIDSPLIQSMEKKIQQ